MSKMKAWINKNVSVLIMIFAMLSLVYSIYRTDVNQKNNIYREAGFELLQQLNQLQLVTDKELYGIKSKERFIDGWANIMMIGDLSIYFKLNIQTQSKTLELAWSENFEKLDTKEANEKVSNEIFEMRGLIKEVILEL